MFKMSSWISPEINIELDKKNLKIFLYMIYQNFFNILA